MDSECSIHDRNSLYFLTASKKNIVIPGMSDKEVRRI